MIPASERRDLALHHAAAWGAALLALAAWWHGWTITLAGQEWRLRIWPGHLLIESVQAITFALGGLTLGGSWWWTVARGRGLPGLLSSLALFTAGCGALSGMLSQTEGAIAAAAVILSGTVGAVLFRRPRPESMKSWCLAPRPWNAAFFVFFVLLNTVSDSLMAGSAPPGWLAATGFFTARLLTQLVLASVLWLALHLGARWWPRGAGWLGWGAVALAPLLVLADIALRLAWTKDLHHLCAEIENGGRVDMLKVRDATGIGVSPAQVGLLALIVLAAPAWYLATRWLSHRRGWRVSGMKLGALALTAWVLLMVVNVAGMAWQSREWRHWESRAGVLHITPFAPPRGMVTFEVQFADPLPSPAIPTLPEKPDVFLFIVETLRDDAIVPEHAPFLARWKAEECQPLGDTRAASNATHLSWFSILHGRLPCYYAEASRVTATAPLLSLLHSAGYALEVRSSGNFDYEQMNTSNFGDGSLLRVMEHTPEGHAEYHLPKPERERRLFQQLRDSVYNTPPGGVLRLTTVDTAHYPYKWHADWQPPYDDFEQNPIWPLRPTPEEVERVRRRYWNSVSWGDHLLGEFITWLKAQGRYDRSLIVVTGDHGEEFKEHGSWFHCSALNKEQTRVPLLIKWPAGLGRGPALTDASHLDLLPSILDAAGVPENAWRALPGKSLRRTEPLTSIVNTCYNSQNGEALLWRRDGWEAAFSWSAAWALAAPGRLWLERLEGPDGPVTCASPAEYEQELRRRFPDAFARLFTECRRAE